MKINQTNLQKAIQQVTAEKIMFCDEAQAVSWLNAIEKAEKNLRENHTIYFVDGTLYFKSLDSQKNRIVTASGCVPSFCDCKDGISYHKALHAILTRLKQLETEPLVEGERVVESCGGIETHYTVVNGRKVKTVEKCGGVVIWRQPQPSFTPPVGADSNVVLFKSKSAKSKSLSITELPEAA